MVDSDIYWPAAPPEVFLDRDNIHVWGISLQASSDALIRLSGLLSATERRRAKTFHFERDRCRYIIGRGIMRTILARYLRVLPEDIELTNGLHGKPLLTEALNNAGLQFNLAHCEDLALLAVTLGREVGVDLERIRDGDDIHEISPWVCSPREHAELHSLPSSERGFSFTRLWTRKEAWLKATGEGITELLEQVEVSFAPGQEPRFICLPDGAGTPVNAWTLVELTPAPGFVAALALPGDTARLSCWKYKEDTSDYAH